MVLYCILVPTVQGNSRGKNKYYTTRHHRLWDKRIREITGGLSICAPIKGQWVSPDGNLFSERMLPVLIACNATQIEEIADFTAKHYEQLAVMYYKVSDEVHIKHYAPAAP